jgi:ATP phosphoribosyltransferase regulatory subunit
MKDYDRILRRDERAVFDLRELYGLYGYTRYKTGKFEEYELYARNKDFLGTDGILTFTDSKGRLKALKPDVTLSIAKNTDYLPGIVQKYYYDEYVYRLSKGDGQFREIKQTGIECIGSLGSYDVCEVIMLAVRSLAKISDDYVLDISHMGIVRGLASQLGLPDEETEAVLRCVNSKNVQGAAEICRENGVPADLTGMIETLIGIYGPMDEVLGKIGKLVVNNTMQHAVDELSVINDTLKAEGLDRRVRFDFSVVNDMGYYNGVIFQGFVNGIATNILSGGRYDNLMKKMGRGKSGAIGFSLSLDALGGLGVSRDVDVDYLIIDRPGESLPELNEAVERLTDEGKSVLVQKEIPENIRYGVLAEVVDGEVKKIETDD